VEVGHLGQYPDTLFTVIPHHFMVCSFDPGGDPATMEIAQVRQDENPGGNVDAQLTGGTLLLRSERDGQGRWPAFIA
jgi:hypothetical protein